MLRFGIGILAIFDASFCNFSTFISVGPKIPIFAGGPLCMAPYRFFPDGKRRPYRILFIFFLRGP